MYVDGNLMEGGMAERDHARTVFESIVSRMKDPALLEWVDGSTFKMRVFPLEGRQEKRIILSYTQKLASAYGRSQYRFPSVHSLEAVRDWSFHARIKQGAKVAWSCTAPSLEATSDRGDLLLDGHAREVKMDRDVALSLDEPQGTAEVEGLAQFSSAEHENARYLMLRYRPRLPTMEKRQRRDWIFLFETSGGLDPLLARVQVDVIRTLLSNAEHDDTFTIVTAATHAHTFAPKSKPVTPENVQDAVRFLEHSHLVGGLDLGRAFTKAAEFISTSKSPCFVHVGSGLPGLGSGASRSY
jgi:hypothetical protein